MTEFEKISNCDDANTYFKLTSNSSYDLTGFTGIPFFKGTLDGNGKTLTNWGYSGAIDNDLVSFGLFYKNIGTIKDLTLEVMSDITPTGVELTNIGALVGWNFGTIENIDLLLDANAKIEGIPDNSSQNIGGLIGYNDAYEYETDATVTGILATINGDITCVAGNSGCHGNLGGVIGSNNSSSIHTSGFTVSGDILINGVLELPDGGNTGGLIGLSSDDQNSSGVIQGSVTVSATGEILSEINSGNAGGMIGYLNATQVIHSSSLVNIAGKVEASVAGGVLGTGSGGLPSTLLEADAVITGEIFGTNCVGGYSGYAPFSISSNASITINGGSVGSESAAGGVFGCAASDDVEISPHLILQEADVYADHSSNGVFVGGVGGLIIQGSTWNGTVTYNAPTSYVYCADLTNGTCHAGGLIGNVNHGDAIIDLGTGVNIQNIEIAGSLTVGGLIGFFQAGDLQASQLSTISAVINLVEVSSVNPTMGGVIGYLNGSTLDVPFTFSGTITGGSNNGSIVYKGGIVGLCSSNIKDFDELNMSGTISGYSNYAGGLCAVFSSGEVGNGEFNMSGSISGGSTVGGAFGYITSTSTMSTGADRLEVNISGPISGGGGYIGGLAGYVITTGTVGAVVNFLSGGSIGCSTAGCSYVAGGVGVAASNISDLDIIMNPGSIIDMNEIVYSCLGGILGFLNGTVLDLDSSITLNANVDGTALSKATILSSASDFAIINGTSSAGGSLNTSEKTACDSGTDNSVINAGAPESGIFFDKDGNQL